MVTFFSLEDQTKSGIPTTRWISRILYRQCYLEKQGRDFLFVRDNTRKAIIEDYDPMFRNLLERGQKMHPELFDIRVFIGYLSLRIIPRSGATTEADNNNVYTADIELINL